MKTQLECKLCGIKFWKENGELNRRISQGQINFFCSRKCGGSHQGTLTTLSRNWGKWNQNLQRGNIRNKDEYSPFREHLRRARRRNHSYDITVTELKTQWDLQSGKCAYSKVPLKLHDNSNPIFSASLDRIDSSRGYVLGNIQWVSIVMNHAKNSMTHEQTLEFCNILKDIH